MFGKPIVVALGTAAAFAASSSLFAQQDAQPAAAAFDKLKSLDFAFDGGSNLDPAKDGHMHAGRIEFLGPDRVKAQWIGWDKGKPSAHSPTSNLARKKV